MKDSISVSIPHTTSLLQRDSQVLVVTCIAVAIGQDLSLKPLLMERFFTVYLQ